jgi:NADPH:quinone reductase-like Zn-dependent oxidoreductase
MAKMNLLWWFGVLPLGVAIYHILNLAFRVPFTVHETGIVVISGASTGIGRHAAENIALAGYHVFAGVRKEADAKSITDTGIATLHPLMLDVTKHESVVEAIQQVSVLHVATRKPSLNHCCCVYLLY